MRCGGEPTCGSLWALGAGPCLLTGLEARRSVLKRPGRGGYLVVHARLLGLAVIAMLICLAPTAHAQCGEGGADLNGPLNAQSIRMDGKTQYIDVNDGVYFHGSPFTVEAWVRTERHGYFDRIIDFSNGASSDNIILASTFGDSGKPSFWIYIAGTEYRIDSPVAIPTNRWTHIAATYNAGTMRLYINFVEVASRSGVPAPRNLVRTVNYIGESPWAEDAPFRGNLSLVRIWSMARSPQDLQLAAHTLFGAGTAFMVAQWSLDLTSPCASGSCVRNSATNQWDGIWRGTASVSQSLYLDTYMRGVADACRTPVIASVSVENNATGIAGNYMPTTVTLVPPSTSAYPITPPYNLVEFFINGVATETAINPNGTFVVVRSIGPLREGPNEIFVRVKNAANLSIVAESRRITVMGTPRTQIRQHPQSVIACPGAAAAFRVDAVGPNIGFQWTFNGQNIPGATSSTYVIPTVGASVVGAYAVKVTYNTNIVAISNNATLSIATGSDCGQINDFYAPLIATEVVRSEFARVNPDGSSPNRIPRLAAVAAGIGEVAALNPNATPEQLSAFAAAYDTLLRTAFADDIALRRSVHFLAAVRSKGRVLNPAPPATGQPTSPLIGLNTNIGSQVLAALGVDFDDSDRQSAMVKLRHAYALDLASSRHFARVLLRGFRGQDGNGNANPAIAAVLTDYFRSQGIEPFPTSLGAYPEVALALTMLPRTPQEFADAIVNGFEDQKLHAVDQLTGLTQSLADSISNLSTIDNAQPDLLAAMNAGASAAITQQIIAQRILEAQQQAGPRAAVSMLAGFLENTSDENAEFANQTTQLWETESRALRATSAIGQALAGAGSIYQQIGNWGTERFMASSLTSGVGGLATGAAILVSMFGPSPVAEIIGDIVNPMAAVTRQIEALRAEMNARFDRVDAKLDNVLETVEQGFSTVIVGQRLTLEHIAEIQLGMSSLQSDLERMEGNLYGILADGFEQQLVIDMDYALGYRDQYDEDLSFTTGDSSYSAFASTFNTWAYQLSQNQIYGGREFTLINDGSAARMLGVVTESFSTPGAPTLGSPLPIGSAINNLRTFPAMLNPPLPALATNRLSNPNTLAFATSAFEKLANENPWYFAKAYANPSNLQSLTTEGARVRDAMLSIRRSQILPRLIAEARTRATAFDAELNGLASTVAAEAQIPSWNIFGSPSQSNINYPTLTLTPTNSIGGLFLNTPTGMADRLPVELRNFLYTKAGVLFPAQAAPGQPLAIQKVSNPRIMYSHRITFPFGDYIDLWFLAFDFDIAVRVGLNPLTEYIAYRETYISGAMIVEANWNNSLINAWNQNQGNFVRTSTIMPQPGRLIQDINTRQVELQRTLSNAVIARIGTTGSIVATKADLLDSSRALLDAYISVGLPQTLEASDAIRAILRAPGTGLGRDALVKAYADEAARVTTTPRTAPFSIAAAWNARLDTLNSMLIPSRDAASPDETHPQFAYSLACLDGLKNNATRLLNDDLYVVAPGTTLVVPWTAGILANDATQGLDLELRRRPSVDLSRLPAGHAFTLNTETRDIGGGATRTNTFGGFTYTAPLGFSGDVVLTYTASVDLSNNPTPNLVTPLPANIRIRVATCAPTITQQPLAVTLVQDSIATFSIEASAPAGLRYQWRRNAVPLSDGPAPSGSSILGAQSPILRIVRAGDSDVAQYDCVVSSDCGSIISTPAALGSACPADVDDGSSTGNRDGAVTIDDLLYFLISFEMGTPAADLDDGSFTGQRDDAVTIDDLLFFLTRFESGC